MSVALACALMVLTSGAAWARVAGGASPAANKAPKVVNPPEAVTVEEGQTAVFEATASGIPTPTVQWEVSTNAGASWSSDEGATADQLTIPDAKTSESGDEYRAVFKNSAGQATSRAATLTVQQKPHVTEQPLSVTVEEGQSASFEVAAAGVPAPSVEWEVSSSGGSSWIKLSKAISDQLTIASTNTSESGDEYRATFTNVAGQATSMAATLTVQLAPKVTKQPADDAVEVGGSASFEATAAGVPTPSVQWEISTNAGSSWSPVEGATTDRLMLANAMASETGDKYRAFFENAAGHATSKAATLSVQDAPRVTQQPANVIVEAGQSASFEVAAVGSPTPSVQWELSTNAGSSWAPVEGATTDQLTIASVQASESGDEYRAVFASAAGGVTSTAALLTVATHHYDVLDWGENVFGQLGDGSTVGSDVPVTASGLDFVTAVAGGEHHSLALLSDGTVRAWGEGEFGQLGVPGEIEGSDVPVTVQGLSGVTAIAAGGNYSLALLSDGTVMAWGGNESGQLGDGSTEESELPVPVKGLTGVTAIAAGGEHSLALLGNGTVKAWGENELGQLGTGNLKESEVPVSVKGLTGVTAIAAGGEHSLALLSNGTVKAWGADDFGQLGSASEEGEGEESRSDVPVAVGGLSGVSALAAGARHSLALLAGGTVMAWGEDKLGQLGNGTSTRSEQTPVAVSGLAGVTAVAAGGEHSLALLGNGSVEAWGENKFGELGDGSTGGASDVPVAVSGVGEIVGIGAGSLHDLAFGEPIPTVTDISPAAGPLVGGTAVSVTGIDLSEATAVSFGGTAASFTVNSPTSITAIAPAHAAGTVGVTVTIPAGTSPASPADQFTYAAPPVVTKVSPKSGPGKGGTTVTITGERLSEATGVSFGSSAATNVVVKSATSLTAVSPPGVAGAVNVTVTSPYGTSAISGHDHFKFKKK